MTTMKIKKRREDDSYKPILDALNAMPGTLAVRVKNEASYSPRLGRYITMKGQQNSVADIIGVKRKVSMCRGPSVIGVVIEHSSMIGRGFAFEVKREGEVLRPDQRRWLEDFASCGGYAAQITDAMDAIECWKEI